MKNYLLLIVFLFSSFILSAQEKKEITYAFKKDVSYVEADEKDSYKKERCKVDIYYPENAKDYPTIVWFHGGGLEGGGKHIPDEFKNKGFAVVAVNYRLSPKAKNPAYLEDAGQSVAWVIKNIASYGGDPDKVFVSGHSAGGYLTLVVGLDKSYMAKYGVDADRIAGLAPISGQTNTHYTIRKERGLPHPDIIPLIDEYAPINKVRKDLMPILLVAGDRRLEMNSRWEENAHLSAVLKGLGNKDVLLYEIEGFDHGTVFTPGCLLTVEWIRKQLKKK